MKRYIDVLREALCAKVKDEHARGELKLGGDGKVVEIDEMFLCHRKYNAGREQSKRGLWFLV